MKRGTLIFVLLAGLLVIPASAYAQERGPTKDEIIEASQSGPAYLDSYWTSGFSFNQTGAEEDVGPGNGASTLAVVLINRGPSDIAGITGFLSLPEDFEATGKASGSPAVATFNQIARVGNPFTLFFDVDVLDTAAVGEYSAQLRVDYSRYFETGTPRSAEISVPFRITGEPILAVSRASANDENEISSQIAAGKIEDFAFIVANKGTSPITNVVVTMESPAESLKILGDSKWSIQRIEEGSQQILATKVFAASALIGNPASFDVTVEYSSNGQSDIEGFTLGTYVAGEISIKAYDIESTYIGGTPNIVGSLLNEGNTAALFTTIEVVSADGLVSSLPPSQYIGDLEENSPLPFSIPVDVGSAGAGKYPVLLKVSYKDNLRLLHTIDISSEVSFVPEQPAEEPGAFEISMGIPAGIGAAVAAAIAAAVLVRRKKKNALRRTITEKKQDDIESLLDSHQRLEKRHEDRK
ncbi:MAG: COG1361 S-layer family protein [Nitrososphaera sp.]